jgi:hypothetical protein
VAEPDPLDRLANARGFVFDMDGTLVLGDRRNHELRPLPGAVEIISWVDYILPDEDKIAAAVRAVLP